MNPHKWWFIVHFTTPAGNDGVAVFSCDLVANTFLPLASSRTGDALDTQGRSIPAYVYNEILKNIEAEGNVIKKNGIELVKNWTAEQIKTDLDVPGVLFRFGDANLEDTLLNQSLLYTAKQSLEDKIVFRTLSGGVLARELFSAFTTAALISLLDASTANADPREVALSERSYIGPGRGTYVGWGSGASSRWSNQWSDARAGSVVDRLQQELAKIRASVQAFFASPPWVLSGMGPVAPSSGSVFPPALPPVVPTRPPSSGPTYGGGRGSTYSSGGPASSGYRGGSDTFTYGSFNNPGLGGPYGFGYEQGRGGETYSTPTYANSSFVEGSGPGGTDSSEQPLLETPGDASVGDVVYYPSGTVVEPGDAPLPVIRVTVVDSGPNATPVGVYGGSGAQQAAKQVENSFLIASGEFEPLFDEPGDWFCGS
jgi:hypothetical protein